MTLLDQPTEVWAGPRESQFPGLAPKCCPRPIPPSSVHQQSVGVRR